MHGDAVHENKYDDMLATLNKDSLVAVTTVVMQAKRPRLASLVRKNFCGGRGSPCL